MTETEARQQHPYVILSIKNYLFTIALVHGVSQFNVPKAKSLRFSDPALITTVFGHNCSLPIDTKCLQNHS